MASWFPHLLATQPRFVVAALAVATLFLALGINPEMRPVLENNLPDSDPHVREHNAAYAIFGDNDMAAIAVVCPGPNGVFEPSCLSDIRSVAETVEASEVVSPGATVFSLTGYAYIESAGDDTIHVGDLVDQLPSDAAEIYALHRKVMEDQLLAGKLVSDDAEAALIVFRLSDDAEQNSVHDLLSPAYPAFSARDRGCHEAARWSSVRRKGSWSFRARFRSSNQCSRTRRPVGKLSGRPAGLGGLSARAASIGRVRGSPRAGSSNAGRAGTNAR